MIVLAETGTIPISALIAAAVSALVTVAVNAFMNRGHNERMVYGQVQKLIEFAMAYPFLEDDDFCNQWPDVPDDESGDKKRRYEHYCCHVFNTLARAYALCSHGTTEMKTYLYPDELIIRHRKWWKSDVDNATAYDTEFQAFVNMTIARFERSKPVFSQQ